MFAPIAPPAKSRRFGHRGAFIGTSIVAQAHGALYSGANLSQVYSLSRAWLTWLEIFSFGAVRVPVWPDPTVYTGWEGSGTRGVFGANLGVSGQTAQQILDRVAGTNGVTKTVFDYYADYVFLDQGTNDISGSTTAAEILELRKKTIQLLVDKGITVFVLPIRIRGSVAWTTASRQKANYVNQLLRDWVAKKDNVYFLDWNRPMVDGLSATGEPRSGYLQDGTHDAPDGGAAIAWWMWHGQIWNGTSFVQDWAGLKSMFVGAPAGQVYSNDSIYSAADNPRGNLLPNGHMLGTGGAATAGRGVSGTVPSNYAFERSSGTGSTTGVGSIAARSDGMGNEFVMTFTPGGTAKENFYLRTSPSSISVAGLGGQWIESAIDVDVAAYAGWFGVSLLLRDDNTPNGTTNVWGNKAFNDGTLDWKMPSFPWKGRLRTPCYQLAAAATTVTNRLETIIKGDVAGSPVIKASRFVTTLVDDPTTNLAA